MKPISIEDLLKMVNESVTNLPKCLLTFTQVLIKFGSRECVRLSNEIFDEYEHFSLFVENESESCIAYIVSHSFGQFFNETKLF